MIRNFCYNCFENLVEYLNRNYFNDEKIEEEVI